jgi:ADP-ribose pyrophosphatase YjhB (NUDIX family)
LLVKQQFTSEYACWNVPGGGREVGETEEQCVVREIKEETTLDVRVERLLLDGPSHLHSPYRRFKVYLCTPLEGDAQPDGAESIEARWFDLDDPSQLSREALNSDTAYETVQRIREALHDDQGCGAPPKPKHTRP